MSIPQQMVSKVHQGSFMGPLVFSLFVTDLPIRLYGPLSRCLRCKPAILSVK